MAARFLQMGNIKTIQDDEYCGSSPKKTGGCELDKQGRRAGREVWEVGKGGGGMSVGGTARRPIDLIVLTSLSVGLLFLLLLQDLRGTIRVEQGYLFRFSSVAWQ